MKIFGLKEPTFILKQFSQTKNKHIRLDANKFDFDKAVLHKQLYQEEVLISYKDN